MLYKEVRTTTILRKPIYLPLAYVRYVDTQPNRVAN